MEKSRDIISENISGYVAGDPNLIPFAGPFTDIRGFERFFKEFFKLLHRPDKTTFSAPILIVEGMNVVAIDKERVDMPGIAVDSIVDVMIRMRFERGKMVLFEDVFDTASGSMNVHALRQKLADGQDWSKK